VGDIISGARLGLFGRGHQALGPNARANFLNQVCSGNYAIIRVFWTSGWLFSVYGQKIMATKCKSIFRFYQQFYHHL